MVYITTDYFTAARVWAQICLNQFLAWHLQRKEKRKKRKKAFGDYPRRFVTYRVGRSDDRFSFSYFSLFNTLCKEEDNLNF